MAGVGWARVGRTARLGTVSAVMAGGVRSQRGDMVPPLVSVLMNKTEL